MVLIASSGAPTAAEFDGAAGLKPDAVFDGGTLDAFTGSDVGADLANRFRDAVTQAKRDTHLDLLARSVDPIAENAHFGVSENGDAVLWFEPLCLLTFQCEEAAVRAMASGGVTLDRYAPFRLCVPTFGLAKVRIETTGGIAEAHSGSGQITSPSEGQFEIESVQNGPIIVEMKGHRAKVVRAGPVIPLPIERPSEQLWSSFEDENDPFSGARA